MTAATGAWALVAVALVVAPSGPAHRDRGGRRFGGDGQRHRDQGHRDQGHRDQGRRGQGRQGQGRRDQGGRGALLAAAAVGCACPAALGMPRGVLIAAVLSPAAFALLQLLARRPVRAGPDRSVALTVDLVAAALRSGRPLGDALVLAVPAADMAVAARLTRVAGLLRLGAEPGQAWALIGSADPLAAVSAVAVRSAASGLRLAAAFERLAVEIRAEASAVAASRAQRAGVSAMAPLGVCFLPSFVCLGVVPVVVGIASTALGVVP